MNTLVLISSLLCAYHYVLAVSDDSTETTTAKVDITLSTGPVDLDTTVILGPNVVGAFYVEMDTLNKSLGTIKTKASQLELIQPKIHDAVVHIFEEEKDVASNLQNVLQQLTINNSVTKKSVAIRRRRNVTPDASVTEPTVAKTSSSDAGNTGTGITEFSTESVTVTTADVTLNADFSANEPNVTSASSTAAPSTST